MDVQALGRQNAGDFDIAARVITGIAQAGRGAGPADASSIVTAQSARVSASGVPVVASTLPSTSMVCADAVIFVTMVVIDIGPPTKEESAR